MKSLTQQTDKINSLTKLSTALLYLVVFIQWVTLFLVSWREFPFIVAWKTEGWSFGRFDVKAVTIDNAGDPWLISQSLFGDDNKYQLWHVTDEAVNSWNLPSVTFEEIQFASIAKDKEGSPWLILGKRLAHWDGNQWSFTPTPFDAEIIDLTCSTVVIEDSMVWGIDYAATSNRIIQLDLSEEPIQAKEIPSPEGLDSQERNFSCILSAENGLLAVVTNKEQVKFYQLQNEKWHEITSFGKDLVSSLLISDVAVGPEGQIWVAFRLWNEGKHVGKYDPITGKWTWPNIERQPEFSDYQYDYGHIAIDNFGRVWLSAVEYGKSRNFFSFGNVNANTVGVFEERSGNKLVEIRHYSSKNSSVQTDRVSKLIIGPDQKIWSWSQQLVWMDGSQQDLPRPLSKWFILVNDNKVVFVIFSVIMLVVITIVQARIRKHKSADLIKKA